MIENKRPKLLTKRAPHRRRKLEPLQDRRYIRRRRTALAGPSSPATAGNPPPTCCLPPMTSRFKTQHSIEPKPPSIANWSSRQTPSKKQCPHGLLHGLLPLSHAEPASRRAASWRQRNVNTLPAIGSARDGRNGIARFLPDACCLPEASAAPSLVDRRGSP